MELLYDWPIYQDDLPIEKTSEFTRLTPLWRSLRIRKMYPRVTAFADQFAKTSVRDRFAKMGEETVNGTLFEIWESEQEISRYDRETQTYVYDGQQWLRSKVWLSPMSGVVGRIEYWFKGPTTNGEWVDDGGIDLVERDVVPPPGTFDTTPPQEFTLKNTKETARIVSISDDCSGDAVGDLEIRYHIGFNFSDGTILLGWSSQDPESSQSQAPLFQDLLPGGPLPKLPIEIHTILPTNPDCHLTYTGHHLAWTQKEEQFYEWSLFVPDKDLTSPSERCAKGFELKYTIHSANATALAAAEKKKLLYTVDWTLSSARINGPTDFQNLAMNAMAELSESGTAPEYVTYEYVMQLCQEIRASLSEP